MDSAAAARRGIPAPAYDLVRLDPEHPSAPPLRPTRRPCPWPRCAAASPSCARPDVRRSANARCSTVTRAVVSLLALAGVGWAADAPWLLARTRRVPRVR